VAAIATAVGVEPEVAGKPELPAAQAVAARLGLTLDDPALAQRLVMVGDMLSTDALFAERLGCPFALVRTGNTPPGVAVAVDPAFDGPDLYAFASSVLAGS
jgi:ribonucleotide monophosphatase NagD (HAD superfamily)